MRKLWSRSGSVLRGGFSTGIASSALTMLRISVKASKPKRESGAIFVGLLFLAVTACQQKSDNTIVVVDPDPAPRNAQSSDPDLDLEHPTRAQSVMIAARVDCDRREDCESGVGVVLSGRSDGKTLDRCTGFLISSDVLVTSSRCVPDDLLFPGSSCAGRIRVAFPSISGVSSTDNVACSQVVYASTGLRNDERPAQEYAFLKLSRAVKRSLLKISREGVPLEDAYQVIRFEPYSGAESNSVVGVIRSVSCKPVVDSILLPGGTRSTSAVLNFTDCGSSDGEGAPILSRDGSIRGILYGRVENSVKDWLRLLFRRREAFREVRWVGNLACIQAPTDPAQFALPASCAAGKASEAWLKEIESSVEKKAEQLRLQADAAQESWAKANSRVFRWQAAAQGLESGIPIEGAQFRVMARPLCFQPTSAWLGDYRWWFGYTDRSATVELELPVWQALLGPDDVLKLQGALLSSSKVLAQIQFRPSDVSKSGKCKVDLLIQDETGKWTAQSSQEVPLCSP